MNNLTEIDNKQLGIILDNAIDTFKFIDPILYEILYFLKIRGMRVGDVLTPSRWTEMPSGNFTVQLSKGDNIRWFKPSIIPKFLLEAYRGSNVLDLYTYSAVNHSLKKVLPLIYIEGSQRPSTSHLFRYWWAKDFYAKGVGMERVRQVIGHKNIETTKSYVNDRIYLYEANGDQNGSRR